MKKTKTKTTKKAAKAVKKTTAKPLARLRHHVSGAIARGEKKPITAKKAAPKRATTFGQVRQRLEEALGVPAAPAVGISPLVGVASTPAPIASGLPPVPTATNQAWRANVDWVAAGKKAHESRLRNAALRAAAAGAPVPSTIPAPVMTTPPARPAKQAPVAPKEEHTSTSTRSRPLNGSRTSVASRRTTTSRSSSSTRR